MLQRLREWRNRHQQSHRQAEEIQPDGLGADTIEYLSDLASESYKRQSELDESIWRSLPFFAVTLAFVATLVGRSALDLPRWTGSPYSWGTHGLLCAAVLSMAWTLRWFWVVLRPREYEYPAADAAVREYAEQMVAFHAASGLAGADLDAKVALEVRLFMVDQLGAGAATNLGHNAVKLKARSKVLLFMLIGFVFAFTCEATIFIHDRAYGSPTMQEGDVNVGASENGNSPAPEGVTSTSPNAAQSAASDRGRSVLGSELEGADQEQILSRKPSVSDQKPTTGSSVTRPTPPTAQIVTKAGRELGSTRPSPRPTFRPDPTRRGS